MNKIICFIPAILAALFYLILGFTAGFSSISIWVWVCIAIMFLSSVFMIKNKWYGCIGGAAVGCLLIFISKQYTGQVIDIEKPLGIILFIYYLVCGIVIYKNEHRLSTQKHKK